MFIRRRRANFPIFVCLLFSCAASSGAAAPYNDSFLSRAIVYVADETPVDGAKGKKGKGGAQNSSQGENKFLSVEELKNVFSDTEIAHVNPNTHSRVHMFFHADGRMTGTSVTTKGRTDPVLGNWFVTPRGTLCFSSEQQGQNCFYLEHHGKDELVRYSSRGTPMPGINWTISKPGPRAALGSQ